MPAERIVRLNSLRDHGRILRHPVVHRLPPIAIGPAVEAAVANRGQIVRRRLVAEAVALVDDGPEYGGRWLPCEPHGVTQAAGEDTALAASQIELIDCGAALLDLHAVLGDVAERADAGIELFAVRARQQAPRPVSGGLERHELAPLGGDAGGARGVW